MTDLTQATEPTQVFTAQCGKCGVLEVQPEATHCPTCNNPLLSAPAAADKSISPAASVPAPTPPAGTSTPTPPASTTGAEPKPAPLEVVTIPQSSTDEQLDKMMAAMLTAVPEDQRPAIIERILSAGLRLAGFPKEEAMDAAQSAMREIQGRNRNAIPSIDFGVAADPAPASEPATESQADAAASGS